MPQMMPPETTLLELYWHSIKLIFETGTPSPGEVDAFVIEEDTYLVLSTSKPKTTSAPRSLRCLVSDTVQVVSDAPIPGIALERPGNPIRYVAITYDFSAEPCCQIDWVSSLLADILQKAQQKGVRSLAMPCLGVRHGPITEVEFLSALRFQILQFEVPSLSRIHLWDRNDELAPLIHAAAATFLRH